MSKETIDKLKMAEELAEKNEAAAKVEAEEIVKNAKLRAEELLRDSVRNAKTEAEALVDEAKKEKEETKQKYGKRNKVSTLWTKRKTK